MRRNALLALLVKLTVNLSYVDTSAGFSELICALDDIWGLIHPTRLAALRLDREPIAARIFKKEIAGCLALQTGSRLEASGLPRSSGDG